MSVASDVTFVANKQATKQASRQASKSASTQASKQADKQASKPASKKANKQTLLTIDHRDNCAKKNRGIHPYHPTRRQKCGTPRRSCR